MQRIGSIYGSAELCGLFSHLKRLKMSYMENQISNLIDAGIEAMDAQKKYLSYLVVTKFNQKVIKEWHTVEVVHGGLKVRNKHNVETGIGPFLRLRHFYHDEPIVDYPA